MGVGLELFNSKGELIYGKQDRVGVIAGTISYHPSLEMVKRVLNTQADANGYKYADKEVAIFENKNFKQDAVLLPFQYSFGVIYRRDFARYPSFSANTKTSNLYSNQDIDGYYVDYAEIPTMEDWMNFGASLGSSGGFGYVEEASVIMPKILDNNNGILTIGYDAPIFSGIGPAHCRRGYKSATLGWGSLLCLVGIDAMVFNTGDIKNEIFRDKRSI